MKQQVVDHLFRHQYGKMVAILTRIFGLTNLETIEDAVQDTFVKATMQWRSQIPANPEAWLIQAAKNRTVDLLRKIKAESLRIDKISTGASSTQISELFMDHEIEDSQLRMIFVACHPKLNSKDQIAFALKTISGFSTKEIAAALLLKEETIKKRLARARKTILENQIKFNFPPKGKVHGRLSNVMDAIYLTFNEGFHSTNKTKLVREELCWEALRLSKLLLNKEEFRSGKLYALFALMCFHTSRLESKTNDQMDVVDIEHQDRTKWNWQLILLGNNAMNNAMEFGEQLTSYHYEAAIAAEHLKVKKFEETDWNKILHWYKALYSIQPSDLCLLNMSLVYLQLEEFDSALEILENINVQNLEQRRYLYYGCLAKFHQKKGNFDLAIEFFDKAIDSASNQLEKKHLAKQRINLINQIIG